MRNITLLTLTICMLLQIFSLIPIGFAANTVTVSVSSVTTTSVTISVLYNGTSACSASFKVNGVIYSSGTLTSCISSSSVNKTFSTLSAGTSYTLTALLYDSSGLLLGYGSATGTTSTATVSTPTPSPTATPTTTPNPTATPTNTPAPTPLTTTFPVYTTYTTTIPYQVGDGTDPLLAVPSTNQIINIPMGEYYVNGSSKLSGIGTEQIIGATTTNQTLTVTLKGDKTTASTELTGIDASTKSAITSHTGIVTTRGGNGQKWQVLSWDDTSKSVINYGDFLGRDCSDGDITCGTSGTVSNTPPDTFAIAKPVFSKSGVIDVDTSAGKITFAGVPYNLTWSSPSTNYSCIRVSLNIIPNCAPYVDLNTSSLSLKDIFANPNTYNLANIVGSPYFSPQSKAIISQIQFNKKPIGQYTVIASSQTTNMEARDYVVYVKFNFGVHPYKYTYGGDLTYRTVKYIPMVCAGPTVDTCPLPPKSPLAPIASIGATGTHTENERFTIQNQSADQNNPQTSLSSLWTLLDANGLPVTTATTNNFDVSSLPPGTYSISLTVTNQYFLSDTTSAALQIVLVPRKPTANFSIPSAINEGESVYITNLSFDDPHNGSGGGILSGTFTLSSARTSDTSFPVSSAQDGGNLTIPSNLLSAGDYKLSLVVKNTNSLVSDVVTKTFTVLPLPELTKTSTVELYHSVNYMKNFRAFEEFIRQRNVRAKMPTARLLPNGTIENATDCNTWNGRTNVYREDLTEVCKVVTTQFNGTILDEFEPREQAIVEVMFNTESAANVKIVGINRFAALNTSPIDWATHILQSVDSDAIQTLVGLPFVQSANKLTWKLQLPLIENRNWREGVYQFVIQATDTNKNITKTFTTEKFVVYGIPKRSKQYIDGSDLKKEFDELTDAFNATSNGTTEKAKIIAKEAHVK